ncbi:MAG: hypothetical protein A2X28_06130 [Elusimicrobia bacterium GWA2_56_46]|nr:MAG: hypothetical protein A2X28_06130 [Elusimicrobia bacterium GWA2_56_46]OGR54610.1 MAG: hypothetical protein A2X39_02180 [Elusimicrobia bacterium GWC2_56_31]HBW23909.1 hypothetical protein [Elusimicrobiota bacterium]
MVAARPVYAVEFEVIDKLVANGATTLFSSATILVPVTQSASLWASTSTVTPHLFVSTAGNVGLGTSVPGAKLEVAGQVKITGGAPGAGKVLTSDAAGLAAWGISVGDNLGNHVATITLNMDGNSIVNAASAAFTGGITASSFTATGAGLIAAQLRLTDNVLVSSAPGIQYGGVYVSTHIYTPGNIYAGKFYGDGSSITGLAARTYVTATLPVTQNNYVQIGNFTVANGAHNLYVSITVSDAGFSVAKQYSLPIYNDMTGGSWRDALPVSNTGPDGGNDFVLEVNVNSTVVFLRLRRTSGSTAGTAMVGIETVGPSGDIFTPASGTGASVPNQLLAVTALTQLGGKVGISTGTPEARLDVLSAGSAQTDMAQIWRNSAGTVVSSVSATGVIMATRFVGNGSGLTGVSGSDNLGNHIATQNLDMSTFSIVNISSISYASNVFISSAAKAQNGGLYISSHVYIAGQVQIAGGVPGAGKLLTSDANGLAVWSNAGSLGDDLGSHLATTTLNMAGFPVVGVSSISASGIYISTYGEVQTAGVGRGTVAGNARGAGAVDLQVNRSNVTEVASGAYSVISGGQQNTGSGLYAVIAGGSQNTAIDQYSTVGGGVGNSALGDTSTVPGGRQNNAAGAYSFAAGFASTSTSAGAFTWSDSQGVGVNNNVQDRAWFKTRGGFLVTGSTNPYMSGTLDRGVFITGDGLVGISTDMPRAALDIVSTGTLITQYAQIWRNSDGAVVASMTATGVLYPPQTAAGGGGDNLGDHIATMALDMTNHQIMNVSSMTITGSDFSVGASTFVVVGGNVGIGTLSPGAKLDVQGGLIKASGGLVIETRAADPGTPVTGQIWVVVP